METLIDQLLTLLDRIEIEDDASLASQRFEMLEQYGEVVYREDTSYILQ